VCLLYFSETLPCHMTLTAGTSFLTSGQRLVNDQCTTGFVWKPEPNITIPMSYNGWTPGLPPDCYQYYGQTHESCIHYWSVNGFKWNHIACEITGCSICQYAGMYFSRSLIAQAIFSSTNSISLVYHILEVLFLVH